MNYKENRNYNQIPEYGTPEKRKPDWSLVRSPPVKWPAASATMTPANGHIVSTPGPTTYTFVVNITWDDENSKVPVMLNLDLKYPCFSILVKAINERVFDGNACSYTIKCRDNNLFTINNDMVFKDFLKGFKYTRIYTELHLCRHANGSMKNPAHQSHASMENPTTIANKVIDDLKSMGVRVIYAWGEHEQCDVATVASLDRPGLMTSHSCVSTLFGAVKDVKKHRILKLDLLRHLNTRSEECAQKYLSKELERYAIDTSTSSKGLLLSAGATMTKETTSERLDGVFKPSAKVDFVGLNSATLLEIKSVQLGEGAVVPAEKDEKYGTESIDDLTRKSIQQALTRVSTLVRSNALIADLVVLSASPHCAFLFHFRRALHCADSNKHGDTGERMRLEIRRIHHSDVMRILISREQWALRFPLDHLTEDAPLLIKAIGRITNPMLCATRLLVHHENSGVYAVSLPDMFVSDLGDRDLGASLNHIHCVIKVIHKTRMSYEQSYATEAEAVKLVTREYNRLAVKEGLTARFYVLGVCSGDEKPTAATEAPSTETTAAATPAAASGLRRSARVEENNIEKDLVHSMSDLSLKDIEIKAKEKVAQLTRQFENTLKDPAHGVECELLHEQELVEIPYKETSCKWLNTRAILDCAKSIREGFPHSLKGGGCILMLPGEPFTSECGLNLDDWREGVLFSLRAAAAAKRLQTDVRRENTMVFEHRGVKSVQLIDFGYAVEAVDTLDGIPCGKTTLESGARYDCRGRRLQKVRKGESITWTHDDDIEMAMKTLASLYKQGYN